MELPSGHYLLPNDNAYIVSRATPWCLNGAVMVPGHCGGAQCLLPGSGDGGGGACGNSAW